MQGTRIDAIFAHESDEYYCFKNVMNNVGEYKGGIEIDEGGSVQVDLDIYVDCPDELKASTRELARNAWFWGFGAGIDFGTDENGLSRVVVNYGSPANSEAIQRIVAWIKTFKTIDIEVDGDDAVDEDELG